MHNVNRNRANAQEQALKRHDSSWIDGSYRGADGSVGSMQDIDFNHATCEQLAELDTIGPTVARAIVGERTLHGHFLSWDEVQRRMPDLSIEQLHDLQQAARIGSPRVTS